MPANTLAVVFIVFVVAHWWHVYSRLVAKWGDPPWMAFFSAMATTATGIFGIAAAIALRVLS